MVVEICKLSERKIFGPMGERWEWRIRYKDDLYQFYKSSNIITLKVSRLFSWECKKQMMTEVGRVDGLGEDLKKIGVEGWWVVSRDRKILRKPEGRTGLLRWRWLRYYYYYYYYMSKLHCTLCISIFPGSNEGIC